jgi:hypothetical protein
VKKLLLGLAALVMVASGVATVSAYEAHVVNVEATVENALHVTIDKIEFGTVFPEEWQTRTIWLENSTSFCSDSQGGRLEQGTNVDAVDYQVWVVRKKVEDQVGPWPFPVEQIGTDYYYYWLGDAMYLGIFEDQASVDPTKMYPSNSDPTGHGKDGILTHVTTTAAPVLTGTITKAAYGAPDDWYDIIAVGLDVPVFADFHNSHTDVPIKPSGLNAPTVTLTGERNVQGIVLGAEIKIQVTNIYKWTPPPPP